MVDVSTTTDVRGGSVGFVGDCTTVEVCSITVVDVGVSEGVEDGGIVVVDVGGIDVIDVLVGGSVVVDVGSVVTMGVVVVSEIGVVVSEVVDMSVVVVVDGVVVTIKQMSVRKQACDRQECMCGRKCAYLLSWTFLRRCRTQVTATCIQQEVAL